MLGPLNMEPSVSDESRSGYTALQRHKLWNAQAKLLRPRTRAHQNQSQRVERHTSAPLVAPPQRKDLCVFTEPAVVSPQDVWRVAQASDNCFSRTATGTCPSLAVLSTNAGHVDFPTGPNILQRENGRRELFVSCTRLACSSINCRSSALPRQFAEMSLKVTFCVSQVFLRHGCQFVDELQFCSVLNS